MVEEKKDSNDEKYRIYASVSFAILLLIIGVPLWWHTTAVPRVPLPYSGILDLSNLNIKIRSKFFIASTSSNRAQFLSDEIQHAFHNSTLYKIDTSFSIIGETLLNDKSTVNDYEKIAKKFDLQVGQLLLLEVPNLNGILIGSKRSIFFSKDTDSSKLIKVLSQVILRDKSLELTRDALTEPTKYSLDEENRRRFPISPAFDILVTIINPDPEKLKLNADLSILTKNYLEPFLDQLSVIANFSIKSQWLYLIPFDIVPKKILDSNILGHHFALSEDLLPQLITPLEKKLASQVSLHPCINLVLYITPCQSSPLYIYTKSGHKSKGLNGVEAFLSPRWGGVVISNPPLELCQQINNNYTIETINMTPNSTVTIMGVFLGQLRLLLGIPESNENLKDVKISSLVDVSVRDWELDVLLRIRAIEQITSAKLTLQSLAQLLEEISNIVITDTVGNRINKALDLVQSSAMKLNIGDLTNGFLLSKEAYIISEAAFTDPSLLALLYFPDDQKYAVYIPLFLPIMIPVLLSLKNITKYYFSNTKRSEDSSGNDSKDKSD